MGENNLRNDLGATPPGRKKVSENVKILSWPFLTKHPVLYTEFCQILEQLKKFIQNPILIENQFKVSIQHKYMYMYQKKL